MAKYLDESGVRTLWSKIKAKFTGIQSSVDSATSLAGSANRNANDAVSEVSTMKNRVNMISQSVDALAVSKVDATGTVAKSNGVTDYGDRNRTIEIGYAGAGLSSTNYFAAYDATGYKIKDINIANAKNVLGINDKANKTEVYTKSDLTFVLNGTTLTITKQ